MIVLPRFFVNKDQISETSVTITGDDVKHIKKVLRLRAGEKIDVCNGCGTDYKCEIREISEGAVVAEVLEASENTSESPIKVRVFQGMPKSDKMDYIIQKCVELGVYEIIPVIAKRSVSIPKDVEKKTVRWQRIADEAAKQCGRGYLPKVWPAISFSDAMKSVNPEEELVLMPYECERENSLKAALKDTDKKTVSVFIGPEGGFDDSEVSLAEKCGAKTVTLGPRILRTETAPLAVCSAIMYELGDW